MLNTENHLERTICVPRLAGRNRLAAISNVMNTLLLEEYGRDKAQRIVNAVLLSESLGITCFGEITIPHARVDFVQEPVSIFGILPEQLHENYNGHSMRFVWIMVFQDSWNDNFLDMCAIIAQLFGNPEICGQLYASEDALAIRELLKGTAATTNKELEPISLSPHLNAHAAPEPFTRIHLYVHNPLGVHLRSTIWFLSTVWKWQFLIESDRTQVFVRRDEDSFIDLGDGDAITRMLNGAFAQGSWMTLEIHGCAQDEVAYLIDLLGGEESSKRPGSWLVDFDYYYMTKGDAYCTAEIRHLIRECAYYIAETDGFKKSPESYWFATIEKWQHRTGHNAQPWI